MKKQLFIFVIIVMAFAITALIGIQVYWIRNSMKLREANFRRSVEEAVNAALIKLETIEFSRLTTNTQSFNNKVSDAVNAATSSDEQLDESQRIKIQRSENTEISVNPSIQPEISKNKNELPPSITQNNSAGTTLRQQAMLNHIMNRMQDYNQVKNVEGMVTVGLIDTLLRQEFLTRGINVVYEFGVYSPYRNKIVLERTGKYHDELLIKGFSFPLFSGMGLGSHDFLLVYFPQYSKYSLRNLWSMAIASVLLALMIMFAFAYSVFMILKQRKLSELKNDFINNMTHEFKTPISTISLACQALSDKDMPRTDALYTDYIKIIGDENYRLGQMAEKILQTAVLEKGNLLLRLEEVDLHNLIKDAIHKIAIQIEIRDGVITANLNATNPLLKVDKVHLSNVIYNLLDNANKYSPRKPQITISTSNNDAGIFINVQDKGMGISKANQKRIFEKLYRVPTGDVHNVKGFGLGLSYVKFIVERHGGNIQLESELNKGSNFIIFLPYIIPEQKFKNRGWFNLFF